MRYRERWYSKRLFSRNISPKLRCHATLSTVMIINKHKACVYFYENKNKIKLGYNIIHIDTEFVQKRRVSITSDAMLWAELEN